MNIVHENKNFTTTGDNFQKLYCMQDTEEFVGKPYFYPTKKDNGHWYVTGVFCSLSCAKGYLLDNLIDNPDILNLFTAMCLELYNHSEVIAAPPQYVKN